MNRHRIRTDTLSPFVAVLQDGDLPHLTGMHESTPGGVRPAGNRNNVASRNCIVRHDSKSSIGRLEKISAKQCFRGGGVIHFRIHSIRWKGSKCPEANNECDHPCDLLL